MSEATKNFENGGFPVGTVFLEINILRSIKIMFLLLGRR
jgi:hypothetical protein